MQKPYLIQRADIVLPYAADLENTPISAAIDLDYMGSAEFEFGAVGKSLDAIADKADMFKVQCVKVAKKNVFLASFFTDEEREAYVEYMGALYADKIHTKERHKFDALFLKHLESRPGNGRRAFHTQKLWWDILNHCMWSFNADFMKNRLLHHLVNSVTLRQQIHLNSVCTS